MADRETRDRRRRDVAGEGAVDLTGARILVVDDLPAASLDPLRRPLEQAGYKVLVATSGEQALATVARAPVDLVLLDVAMPGMDGYQTCRQLRRTSDVPVVFLTAHDESERVVEGFEAGGVDYVVKPCRPVEVLARIRTHLERARLAGELAARNRELEAEIRRRQALTSERDHLADRLSLLSEQEASRWGVAGFVGRSATLGRILEDIETLHQAPTTPALILGESGTGKELIARAIHSGGAAADGPFLAINCSSIPRELAEALFFGHEKGAFTGAEAQRAGYFELAEGGTLFLDEIGDMPVELQPVLLRVLEDGRYRPVGGRGERAAQVRVVAATNADLRQRIGDGRFREDLYFRLARFTVSVPPLRERREDIDLLARHFVELFAHEMNLRPPPLEAAAVAALRAYAYPGNVRELKNLMERALMRSRGAAIGVDHLDFEAAAAGGGDGEADAGTAAGGGDGEPADLPLERALEAAELRVVRRALASTAGNVAAAARLLETNRQRIYRVLERARDNGGTAPPA